MTIKDLTGVRGSVLVDLMKPALQWQVIRRFKSRENRGFTVLSDNDT